MIKTYLAIAIVAATMIYSAAWAQSASPIGLWKSIDDRTGKPTAIIRITEVEGRFQGRIEKVFPEPGESANPVCGECKGELKDQPIVGMIILSELRHVGDEYTEGLILDPDDGKLYRCTVRLFDGGNRLNIRGYIGIPLLGRTQVWLREQ